MYILFFILMILPGILAARIRESLLRDKLDYFGKIYQFSKFTYLITFINLCALYIRGWETFAFEWISVTFAVKYMGLSLILAVMLPIIDLIISRFIKDKK